MEQEIKTRCGDKMTQSVQVNFKAICVVLCIVIILSVAYVWYPSKEDDISSSLMKDGDTKVQSMKRVEETSQTTWEDEKKKLFADTNLSLKEEFIKVEGNDVFFREGKSVAASVPKGTLLFLHGAAFQSETWSKLGTLHFMANAGYRPIAIDLPGGKGKTKSFKVSSNDGFLLAVKEAFGLQDTPVIIISPSMSGSYSIPLLFSHPEAFKGYVPVAPTSTGSHSHEEYAKVKVPTCIIYGEEDKGLGVESLGNLSGIPGSTVHVLKDAHHPAYLDEPKEFHRILLEFASGLYA